jgi:hypothetical protein
LHDLLELLSIFAASTFFRFADTSAFTQHADDVMVSEACQLVPSSFCEEWLSLAFVTNDAGLVARLRSKLMNHSTKVSDYKDTTGMPLIIDSTRFVELLLRLDSGPMDSKKDDNLALAVKTAQASPCRFAFIQKLGYRYSPRREKTWDRCILAEAAQQSGYTRFSKAQFFILFLAQGALVLFSKLYPAFKERHICQMVGLIKISMIGAGKGHKVKAVERWQQELSWEV